MKNLSLTFCLAIAALFGSVGSGFASDLPDCSGSPTNSASVMANWTNCFGVISLGGIKYVGEFKDGSPDGKGTVQYSTGDKYTGQWKSGRAKHGRGTLTWANGNKYVGEFKDDKTDGQGTLTFANGDKYIGEFKDGKQSGQGNYTYAIGNKFVGEYKDGLQNGQGTLTWADGGKYVGEFRDDKPNGQGTLTWGPNSNWAGDKYVGDFRDGKRNGQGTYSYADGTVEEGIWKDGEFQYAKKLSPPVPVAKTPTQDDEIISASSGSELPDCPEYRHPTKSPWMNCFGTFSWANGDKYVGEFKEDQQHGQGEITFGLESKFVGEKYVGDWKEGKRSGQGIYSYPSGNKYTGGFEDNKRSGEGKYIFANGNIYVGEWKNGERHGLGTFTFANGDKYVGENRNGYFDGKGTFTWVIGNKYVGEHKNDVANGQGTFTFANGSKYVGEFKDDLFNGQGSYTFANGDIKEGIWKDGDFQYAKELSSEPPNFSQASTECTAPIISESIGDWRSQKAYYYDNSDLGLSIEFKKDQAKLTFFVYNLGISSIKEADVNQQLSQAVSDIQRLDRSDENKTVNSPMLLPKDKVGIGHMNKLVKDAVFITSQDGLNSKLEIVTLGSNKNCFLKVRFTTPINSLETKDLISGIMSFSDFMNGLNNAFLTSNYY
ncbi:hypothetical protein N9X05_16885 [Paracoccaceae bacterium]|nr:hypothetical protein [Paracoccaceae bacterium]